MKIYRATPWASYRVLAHPLKLQISPATVPGVHASTMAMRVAFRAAATRPLSRVQTPARPVLSLATRWKGSAAPEKKQAKGDMTASEKVEDAATAAAEKISTFVTPPTTKPKELPVTFEVRNQAG